VAAVGATAGTGEAVAGSQRLLAGEGSCAGAGQAVGTGSAIACAIASAAGQSTADAGGTDASEGFTRLVEVTVRLVAMRSVDVLLPQPIARSLTLVARQHRQVSVSAALQRGAIVPTRLLRTTIVVDA
jgi:hypothetical protein